MIKKIIFLVLVLTPLLFSQLTLEYQSQTFPYNSVSGWIAFKKVGSSWEYRLYYLDSTKFQIYSSHYNGSVQYTYNFTQPEIFAGGYIYSLGIDLTGDGIVEFYVLGKYTVGSYSRQSIRILNIVNNSTILELNSSNYYYSEPTLYDIDRDGILEMIFVEYDMNNLWRYKLIVYNTGVSTSVVNSPNELNFELKQNFPNPFNPSTTIRFNLFKPEKIKIEILNLNGEVIKTLIDGVYPQGQHEIFWDGTNDYHQRVTSGVYFYRLISDEKELTRKMVLIK
ncbi:MAG: T9SS type A sorting domain-containing protein [Ignavibacteria bacterium]|nr:T9SS type A sorting domain-containing protein [Ignavibacteria bacterium]